MRIIYPVVEPAGCFQPMGACRSTPGGLAWLIRSKKAIQRIRSIVSLDETEPREVFSDFMVPRPEPGRGH
jgi:hypothetical protein